MASLNELTAHELKEKILSQEISAEELTLAVFDRVDEVEDKINAYVTLTKENAVKKAKEVDKRIRRNEPVGTIAGIPIAVKDNICTLGVRTTCASHMLEKYIPPYDATVIGRLKQQDGVIVGKTNMDEFAINPHLCED